MDFWSWQFPMKNKAQALAKAGKRSSYMVRFDLIIQYLTRAKQGVKASIVV